MLIIKRGLIGKSYYFNYVIHMMRDYLVIKNNKVKEFLNDIFGEVRTIKKDGELWFVASDIANILEYGITADMTRKLDDDEKGMETLHTFGGNQELSIINESELYNAVLSITRRDKARYEKAKEFKRWITKEVITAIRQNGMYVNRE